MAISAITVNRTSRLLFLSHIVCGFDSNIDKQHENIVYAMDVNTSAINVSNVIIMAQHRESHICMNGN